LAQLDTQTKHANFRSFRNRAKVIVALEMAADARQIFQCHSIAKGHADRFVTSSPAMRCAAPDMKNSEIPVWVAGLLIYPSFRWRKSHKLLRFSHSRTANRLLTFLQKKKKMGGQTGMKTGFCGTYVISWAQTEVDGVQAAPLHLLTIGASWRWVGDAVRVDAPQTVLVLNGAEGVIDVRKRAAKMVKRLIGAGLASPRAALADDDRDQTNDDQSFVVTDGRRSYLATLIPVPDTGVQLVMFLGDVPPEDCDLWVVRVSLQHAVEPIGLSLGGVICFTPGTRIVTPDGTRRIEDLRPGDSIQTKDNGPQQVLWTGHRRMTGARLYAMPHLRPIRFRAGALGIDRPDEDLLVSPQHRMLVKGAAALDLFHANEVLVAAEDLLNDRSICIDRTLREVTYVHVLMEHHQIVWANGLETESFHPSNSALETIDPAQREGLLNILPGLADDPQAYGDFARRNLTSSEAAILRHDRAA
jgi:hypothetical protein